MGEAVAAQLRPFRDMLLGAIVLAHASELTLLILTQAMNAALLSAHSAQAMLVASSLSMGFAPTIIQHNRTIAVRILRL